MSSLKNLLRRGRRLVNQSLGRDVRAGTWVNCRTEFLGTEYGGWAVCPDHIVADSIIYSFGVGEDISFDLALIERFGVEVHAFDPTPKSIAWVKRQTLPSQFHFHAYGLADFDGMARFTLPRADFASFRMADARMDGGAHHGSTLNGAAAIDAPVHRLATIMTMFDHDHVDVLKMDIEGAETKAIPDILASGISIGQWLIEFHHTVGNTAGVVETARLIAALRHAGFSPFHRSPVGKEFSFLRAT